MEALERSRIISEDYADLLINYGGDFSVFDEFEDATVNIINFFYAIVHVPLRYITEDIVLERGYSVMPTLYGLISESSMIASGIRRLRNIPALNFRGQGVLIGIIDTGVDYTNPVFRYADGTTKIFSIWDQTITDDAYPRGKNYGTEFSKGQINEALLSERPFDIVPSRDEIGHGTMLAGIAAGNEIPEQGFYGVAPDAEIVVVKLKQAKQYLRSFFRIPFNVPCYQENDILFGIDYLLEVANRENRPISICVALGSSLGAHDGMGTLSSYLSLIAERPGTAVSIAAGNEGNSRRHYYGVINPVVGFDTVELNIGENESGFTMELWGDSPSVFSIDILTPSGEYIPRMPARLDENREISFIFERSIIYIDYQMIESQSGDQLIMVRFTNPDPGLWRFRVYGRGDILLGFNIWLPMQGFISENTYFINSVPYTTILSLGNAKVPITATAYNHVENSLYANASRGFTRIGIPKPDIAAPGIDLVSPALNHEFVEVTGTSPSAAFVAGAAAILLEWGVVRGNYRGMNSLNIKIFMIRGAVRSPELQYPNPDWGYGILDVYNIFESLRRGR